MRRLIVVGLEELCSAVDSVPVLRDLNESHWPAELSAHLDLEWGTGIWHHEHTIAGAVDLVKDAIAGFRETFRAPDER